MGTKEKDPSVERLARFRCRQCGECCRRHRVPLTHRDVQRLRNTTGAPVSEFVEWLAPEDIDMTGEPESFVELRQGRRLLVLAVEDGACHFLDESGGCRVYSSRPATCRTFPLEPALNDRGRMVHLQLLPDASCDGAFDGSPDAAGIVLRHRLRTQELEAYAERVAAWNKRQRLRRLLNRTAESEAAFFDSS